jgi:formylmethanofuran dehydrogenase subunit C
MQKTQVLGILRHSLTFLGGIVVMKGIVDETTATEIIGGIITLVGTIWSIVDKTK